MKFVQKMLFALLLCGAAVVMAGGGSVNINTADADTLMKILKGVGPAKAEAIVEYRKKNGPFKSPDQLADVSGIGKKLVEENRELITVGEAKPVR